MDDNAKRTDHENQLERLMSILPEDFKCSTSAYYWKAAFVPHPKVMGSVGMQVAVISKYKIDSATRYQLPLMPANFIMQNLNFKRSFIEAVIPVEGGSPLSVMSIHMDAFAQGTDTMQQQVEYVKKTLLDMEAKNQSWLIAGDFNLVPPGKSYDLLPEAEKPMFQKESEISKLYETFNALPKISDVDGPNREKFLTHFPNISKTTDRVLDYYFYSKNIIAEDFYVRQNDTLKISDHLPAIMIFNVK